MKKIISFILCFILCFSFMVVPSSASTFPEFPQPTKTYSITYCFEKDNQTHLYIYSYDNELYSSAKYFPNTEQLEIYLSITASRQTFVLRNGSWDPISNSTSSQDKLTGVTKFLYSDVDIINGNTDEIFFPLPPAETLEAKIMEVVAMEMDPTQTNLLQTMKTIALCGVGCLALLISLVLLVKTLRRYLPR